MVPPGDWPAMRWGGWMVAAGVVLAAASAALHPPTVHPDSGGLALAAVAARPLRWVAIHWLLVAALVLWLGGYLLLDAAGRRRGWCRLAAANRQVVAAALAAWLVVLAFEIEAMPRWAALAGSSAADPLPGVARPAGAAPAGALVPGATPAVPPDVARTVAAPLFAASLTLAYVATGLLWVAQALWALDLGRAGALPPWLATGGWLSGVAAALGIPAAVWLARASPYPGVAVLAVTSGLAGVWHLVVGVRFGLGRAAR